MSVSSQDAERRQQASSANAQLALQDSQMKMQAALDRANSNREDVTTQAALGAQLRAADDQMRKAPISTLNSQIDMFSGLPTSLFTGQVSDSTGTSNNTTKESGASIGELAQLIGGIGSLASGAAGLKTAMGAGA